MQRETALRVPADVALPEELTPLAEALEQAQQRVDQVTALREALEYKVGVEKHKDLHHIVLLIPLSAKLL